VAYLLVSLRQEVLLWDSMQGNATNKRKARGVGFSLGGGEGEVMGCGPQ